MKICTCKTCVTPKELQEFGKDSTRVDGLQRICKECKKAADKIYRESDKGKSTKKKNSQSEYAKEYRKEYYSREEVQIRQKTFKSTDEYKQQQREYANQEHRKIKQKEFQQTEKCKETRSKYRQTQKAKENKKIADGKRRANKKTSVGVIDKQYIESLKGVQDYKCYHCEKELDFTNTKSVHLDHYIPLNKGGLHCISNLVWSCAYCNIAKKDKMPDKPLTFKVKVPDGEFEGK